MLFAKAESLADKLLSCPQIKLSKSQTLILDGVETGVLLPNFAQQPRRKNGEEAGSLSKNERQKL